MADTHLKSNLITPVRVLRTNGNVVNISTTEVILSNDGASQSAIILDYGRAEGGFPVLEASKVSGESQVLLRIVYSETIDGIDCETGDGPYFLFSNAMDTYRSVLHTVQPSQEPQSIVSKYPQRSQRYQKLILESPNSSITLSGVGLRPVRPEAATRSTFRCSNEKLNRIWLDGVRTVDMCTVAKGETANAWDVTPSGTRVYGQHWAPCRHGTRWTDKTVTFQTKIEKLGTSWGVHMVANGLIFCLDADERTLAAFEGLSDKSAVFPTTPRGSWQLEQNLDLLGWLNVETAARGSSVTVAINGQHVASVEDLDIHPILGGAPNNSGPVAFGGPAGWVSLVRNLVVKDGQGDMLYKNDLMPADEARTFADFAVGTNDLPCTIDGAKRDRAVFGGDLHALGRSIYYSTQKLEAAAGSIKLLTSHQTKAGYLGNLCPIQAPVHTEADEPPTYAFYSLGYALLLVVAIKDYWMHSGDDALVAECWEKLTKLMGFTENFVNENGLVAAPPPMSMTWFPMGGPIFGASGQINLAYYDALNSMAAMSTVNGAKDSFTERAELLKEKVIAHLWSSKTGILKMSDHSPEDGLSQDINAYSVSIGVSPPHVRDQERLACSHDGLPLAFEKLERWDKLRVVSPYASGFAAEACFNRNLGHSAVELIERVWGPMADQSNPNYSGGHWETITAEGKPFHKDTSLMHGWSTWPVHLLPRYLAGLYPTAAGWKRFAVKPILCGVETVDVVHESVAGHIEVSLRYRDSQGTGELSVTAPTGTKAEVFAPEGWLLAEGQTRSKTIEGSGARVRFTLCADRRSSESSNSLDDKHAAIVSSDLVGSHSADKPAGKSWISRQIEMFKSAWSWLAKKSQIRTEHASTSTSSDENDAATLRRKLEKQVDHGPVHNDVLTPTALEDQQSTSDLLDLQRNVASDDSSDGAQSSSKEKSGKIMIECQGPKDQADPRNWPNSKRARTFIILFLLVFSQGWVSTCDSNSVKPASHEFHVSETSETLATALFLVGLASGSLIAGPLSEQFGRNPVYIVSSFVFLCFTLGSALAPNFGAQLAFRFLSGVLSSPTLSLYGGSLADLFTDSERGLAWPIFALSPLLSPVLSPVAGGWAEGHIPWRWVYWIGLIQSGFAFLLALFFLPETFSPMILQWRAYHLRRATNSDKYTCELEDKASLGKRLAENLSRPLTFFTTEPIVMALGAYLVVIYVVIFTFLNGFEFIFTDTYGLSPGIASLAFVGISIGALLSTALTPLYWAQHRRSAALRKDLPPGTAAPESRLYPAMAGAPFLPIALFWLGWTNYALVSYWSGYGATVLFGYAMTAVFVSSYSYIIDSYGTASGSALGSITMARYIVSSGLIVASRPMYEGIGVHWTLTLLGILGTLLVPVPFLLFRYGPAIRKRSKFAVSDGDDA
ncbi:hypothetical protein MBLNU459_g7011t1 [Dothideomycetes sp. NU459]